MLTPPARLPSAGSVVEQIVIGRLEGMEPHESDDVIDPAWLDDDPADEPMVVDIPPGPGTGKSIQSMERQRRALVLRRAGAGFQAIADEVGYASAAGAAKAVKRALSREVREAADEYIALQMQRSEQLLMVQWQKAMEGDLAAWDRALSAVKHIDGYVGAQGNGSGSVTVNVGDPGNGANVLVIQGDTDSYKAGLMAMARDHGFEVPDEDFIDADIVEPGDEERPTG